MRYASKPELVDDIELQWQRMWEFIDAFPLDALPESHTQAYKVESSQETETSEIDPTSKPSIDWTVREVLAHVHGWHLLLLDWLKTAAAGKQPATPAPGFKWNQTKALNRKLANDLCQFDYRQLRRKLKASHRRVMNHVEGLSEAELIDRGVFAWTGKNALVSYVGPNTAGHYRWAIRKLKTLIPK